MACLGTSHILCQSNGGFGFFIFIRAVENDRLPCAVANHNRLRPFAFFCISWRSFRLVEIIRSVRKIFIAALAGIIRSHHIDFVTGVIHPFYNSSIRVLQLELGIFQRLITLIGLENIDLTFAFLVDIGYGPLIAAFGGKRNC